MSGKVKVILYALGISTILLILSQLGLALSILKGGDAAIRKAHQHSGYLMVVVSLIYVIWSLKAISAVPTRPTNNS